MSLSNGTITPRLLENPTFALILSLRRAYDSLLASFRVLSNDWLVNGKSYKLVLYSTNNNKIAQEMEL